MGGLPWLYNAVLAVALVGLSPLLAVWVLGSPRLRRDFGERLRPLSSPRDAVWVHAASVGEAEAAVPLLEQLAERRIAAVATTLTREGRDRLRARRPGLTVRLAPLDLPGLVHASLRGVRALVLVETELWPNLLWAARGSGCPALVVSGRLSDASFRRYRRLGPLCRSALSCLDSVAARSAEDAERFVALGAPRDRVVVGGDLKLDRAPPAAPGPELRAAVGPGPLLVAGSTHPGEDEALLEAWSGLRASIPGLRLLLAPRHLERAGAVLAAARKHGARAALRTEGAGSAEVVVLDTLGELAAVYSLADLVFAGGTLVPVGGHNLIEPVQAGRVVVHGPHLEGQRAQAALLGSEVLRRVDGPGSLATRLRELWEDPERDAAARRAAAVLTAHRGAARRAAERVAEILGARGA